MPPDPVHAVGGFEGLVQAIAERRPGADRMLVDRFKARVARLLTRTLGPGPDIDDLMQEVFFRVFQRLPKVRPPGALPGYVTAVTVLVAREALRKRRRSRWLSFLSSEDLAGVTRGYGAVDVPDDVRAFYGALAKVDAHAQLCITLRHVEGMELEEMSRALDLSLASVKRHVKRAEADLGRVLGRERVDHALIQGTVR